MKGIVHFDGLYYKLTHDKKLHERIQFNEFYTVRMNLYKCLYHMYQLQMLEEKKTHLSDKLERQKVKNSDKNSSNEEEEYNLIYQDLNEDTQSSCEQRQTREMDAAIAMSLKQHRMNNKVETQ